MTAIQDERQSLSSTVCIFPKAGVRRNGSRIWRVIDFGMCIDADDRFVKSLVRSLSWWLHSGRAGDHNYGGQWFQGVGNRHIDLRSVRLSFQKQGSGPNGNKEAHTNDHKECLVYRHTFKTLRIHLCPTALDQGRKKTDPISCPNFFLFSHQNVDSYSFLINHSSFCPW